VCVIKGMMDKFDDLKKSQNSNDKPSENIHDKEFNKY
jgi:hypothetical protein